MSDQPDNSYFLNLAESFKPKNVYHKGKQLVNDNVLARSPMFFLFPEMIANPTQKTWYPYVLMLVRIWMYSLIFHHLSELKTMMDYFPILNSLLGLKNDNP